MAKIGRLASEHIAGNRVDAHHRAPERAGGRQALQKGRDHGLLTVLVLGRLLAEHQALIGGKGRHQMQRPQVLPSRARRAGASGRSSRAQLMKQAENRSGSIRFIRVRSQSAQGRP